MKVEDIIELFNNTVSADVRSNLKYMGEFFAENNRERREVVYWDNTILRIQRIDLTKGEVEFRLNKLHKYFDFVSDGLDNTPEKFYIRCRAVYRTFNFEPIAMDLILKNENN